MFFSTKRKAPIDSEEILLREMRAALPDADLATVQVMTAVTGLLAAIAYADREIQDDEAKHLRQELARLNGMPAAAVDAVAQVLTEHALRLSTSFVPRFTRTLREELPPEQRLEVLEALLGMAAADGEITHDEVTSMRNVATALGLSQSHYNALQEKYRDLLK